MNSQSQAKSPERLRAMVAGTLANFQHPTLKHNLTALKALHHVAWLDDTVHIELQMPFVWSSAFEALKEQCSAELLRITGAKAIDWKLTHSIATLKRVKNQPGVNGVKNIIAISSGKGGVGKSSTAVNLALALAAEGAKVGILDADIYGPSIPTMLGAEDSRPTSPDGTHMAPIMKYGLATNSIGYLVTDDNAMVWRGPMASKALMQMLQETLWPDLDYLVLDMPPGTGDIQLTLAQNIPVTKRGGGHHAAGHRADRRQKRHRDVRESGSAGAGDRGKHEHAYLQQLRAPRAYLRHRRRAKTGREIPHPAAGPAAAAYYAAGRSG